MSDRLQFGLNQFDQLFAVEGLAQKGFENWQKVLRFVESKCAGRHGYVNILVYLVMWRGRGRPCPHYWISSIRSNATFAQCFTSSRTLIWFTMFRSTRFSNVQHKCCGEMRNMVVHRHPESSSVMTFFPSAANSLPIRFTR